MNITSHLRNFLADVGTAWRLLTILPLPLFPVDTNRPAGYAAAYYPLVGLVIGLLLAGVHWAAGQLFSDGVTAALVLTVWVALTGMLHLDGFMDSCDGLLPPREPARRLEIMKDSRVGAFGVVGVVLLILLKFNALLSLPPTLRWGALLVAPTLARAAMTWAMGRYPLARSEGLSVFFREGLGWSQVVIAAALAAFIALAVLGFPGFLVLGVAWLSTMLLARFAVLRIHGLTGDIYGAICEVVEVAVLLVIL